MVFQNLKITSKTYEMVRSMFPKMNPDDLNVKLKVKNALAPVDFEYVCGLCDHIVFDTRCCSQCLQHTCKRCISDWLQ